MFLFQLTALTALQQIIFLCEGSPGPLARLQLETEPYESPGSQRSTLRRDSHILAEMAEMESSFTSQEQVEAPRATASAAVTESRDRWDWMVLTNLLTAGSHQDRSHVPHGGGVAHPGAV